MGCLMVVLLQCALPSLSITQHSPEEIREVYNIVAANIEDSKSTFKQGLIKGFEILAQLVKSGKIKLPILK